MTFEAPIKDNERNVAKYGNVVPVKVRTTGSCTGAAITTPQLYLTVVKGPFDDVDEGTTSWPRASATPTPTTACG